MSTESTERTVRMGYRGHLIEVTVERRPDGLWGAKWMIFATRPFLPKRQVISSAAQPSQERARSAAVAQALRWIDSELPPAETAGASEAAASEAAATGSR